MESHGILKSSKSTNPEVCKCGQLIGFEFTSCCFEQIHANVVCLATYATNHIFLKMNQLVDMKI